MGELQDARRGLPPAGGSPSSWTSSTTTSALPAHLIRDRRPVLPERDRDGQAQQLERLRQRPAGRVRDGQAADHRQLPAPDRGLRRGRVPLRPRGDPRRGRPARDRGGAQGGQARRHPDRRALELPGAHRRGPAGHRMGLVERRLPRFPAELRPRRRDRGRPGVFPPRLALVLCQVAGADRQLHGVPRRPHLDRHDHGERGRRRLRADGERPPAHPPDGGDPLHVRGDPDDLGRPGFPAVQARDSATPTSAAT